MNAHRCVQVSYTHRRCHTSRPQVPHASDWTFEHFTTRIKHFSSGGQVQSPCTGTQPTGSNSARAAVLVHPACRALYGCSTELFLSGFMVSLIQLFCLETSYHCTLLPASGSGHPRYDAQEQGALSLQPAPSLAVLLSLTLIQWFVLFSFKTGKSRQYLSWKIFPFEQRKISKSNNKKHLPAYAWGNGAHSQ